MGKERDKSDKEESAGVRKRRKLTGSSTPAPSPAPHASEASKTDLYKRAIEFEESEAGSRSAERDAEVFRKFCKEVRLLLADVADLKTKNNSEANEQINAKRIEASLLLVGLKKLNRLEKIRTKAGRDALNKEKQRVDSTHLLLQNLLYEADHLNKEVTKCLQFKSKDEEIDLVPIDNFYKEAPEEIARPNVTKADEHQLQLARLEWELQQRRQLSAACSELVGSKERVAAAIAATRSRLEALAPHLQDVLKATKPLQECLALKLDCKREEEKAAALLPPPLFLLYANSIAYSDAFGASALSVSISGDEDEARRLDQLKDVEETTPSNDSDSDRDNEDEPQGKKKRHHRSSKVTKEDKAEAKKLEVLKKHPLNVQLSVKIKDGTELNLMFYYLLRLNIVTVKCLVNLPKPVTGVSAADVLIGTNILHGLYPDDTGLESPHPATKYLLTSAGVDKDFSDFIPELGRPFVWAQRMCGLDFMIAIFADKNVKPIAPSSSLSVTSVENVVIKLRKRLRARVELMKELQDLESGKIRHFEGTSFPIKLSGSLTQWQSIGWPEYSQSASTDLIIAEGLVNSNDLLYRAIITRQSAKLVALVALKSGYPKIAPIFSLTLHWNGTHNAGTDDDIRDIERVINTDYGTSDDETVSLSSQITKLLMCLDILLEAIGSSEFPPDKVMLNPVRSRNRSKPYNFLKQGTGVFTQY